MMDLQILMPWVVAASTLLSFATAVYTLLSAGAKKTAADLEAYKASQGKKLSDMEEKQTGHGQRIQGLEAELRHLPDRDATHRLELAVEKLNGRIETLDERLKPVDALGRRLQEFLVRQAERQDER